MLQSIAAVAGKTTKKSCSHRLNLQLYTSTNIWPNIDTIVIQTLGNFGSCWKILKKKFGIEIESEIFSVDWISNPKANNCSQ